MYRSTAILLILMRLVIGWHFLFEGVQKVQSVHVGETVYARPFSSAVYFREAPGPLGRHVRSFTGDPDDEALARLVVRPLAESADPATDQARLRMPPGLKKDWDDYLRRFTEHYGLDDDQATRARAKLDQAEVKVVQWLTYQPAPVIGELRSRFGRLDAVDTTLLNQKEKDAYAAYTASTTEQRRAYPGGDVTRRMTMSERIDEYRARRDALNDLIAGKMWAFARDVEGARLRQAKAEVVRLRAGLMKDLDEQSQSMRRSLDEVLATDQKELGEVPDPAENRVQWWIDWATRWGLTALGACLLIGLFTRTSCVLAAGFLLGTYLLYPAFPWLPVVGPSESPNYLFVNKNVVEMLALLVLATTDSGRWFGVDAVLHAMFGGRKKA